MVVVNATLLSFFALSQVQCEDFLDGFYLARQVGAYFAVALNQPRVRLHLRGHLRHKRSVELEIAVHRLEEPTHLFYLRKGQLASVKNGARVCEEVAYLGHLLEDLLILHFKVRVNSLVLFVEPLLGPLLQSGHSRPMVKLAHFKLY